MLVAGLIEIGKASEFSQRIMAAIAGGRVRHPLTAWHCCPEFYSVATRLPEEFRLAPEDASRLVEEEVLARFDVRQLPEHGRLPFLRTIEQERIVGGRVYDAHIAEVARLSGARTVITDNRRHFSSVARHGVNVLTAEEFTRSAHLLR